MPATLGPPPTPGHRNKAGCPGAEPELALELAPTWRRNPVRVSLATSRERLARQRVAARWPRVTIIPPG